LRFLPAFVVFLVPVAAVLLGFADELTLVCPATGATNISTASAEASHLANPLARDGEFVPEVGELAAETGDCVTFISPL